ncbi:PAS domain S-box protein [Rivularia sp. UHCC 0363]|uniref:PAS domain S-box protein n=1 Tax=Rivularia sp. UHCC 0363 TaxID=3110244 RepID=UPI002B216F2A|nr:PAS domain S-box protein [Rivularia sp. UHCC 0363]MEA5598666.1 PAS domain S-box protein [Rivularia sp. UHCC 0363]
MNQNRYPAENNLTTQTDARLGRIMQAIAQVIWCANADGQATYFNQQWYQLTGLDENQSLGLNFLQAVDPQQRNRVAESWLSAIQARRIWKDEFRIIHQDNQAYWYAASAQPYFDEHRQIIEWVAVCHNIDEAKRKDAELEEHKEFLKILLSEYHDGVVACDQNAIASKQQSNQEANLEVEKYFERLTLALDAAKMGSWHWDSFTNKNIWTPYHDVIFGYEPSNGERTYEDWSARIHPDDLPLAEAAWKIALREHQDYVCEYRIVLPDGVVRWVESYGRYYYDDTGQALRMAGTVTDITNRKKQQQALQESERRYSTLAQISPVGIFSYDTSANLSYVNQRWCEITGYSFEQVVHQGWREIIHPEDKARVEAEVERTIKQQIPLECEFRFQRPDQSIVWVFVQSVPEINADRVISYVGTATDITQRKQSESALQESEKRFRSTFEQAAVGIAHADLSGKFIRVNQKLCDILSYSREELLQLRFHEITYQDDLESDLKQVRDLLADRTENFSMDKRYVCKNGSIIWVEMTVSFVRRANGSPEYFLGVIQDISQRKQAETQMQLRSQELEQLNILLTQTTAQLRKRNSELDQFAYVASHDLKAPLRAIANLSQWLEDDLSEVLEVENRHHLELLRQRVYRMEALIDGLLQYSRIGRVDVAEEMVDVGMLLEEIIENLAPPENFTIEVKHPMPILNTKGIMLKRVLINLIDNAITHHHGSSGHINISVEEKAGYYEFAISDDGPGISPQYHDKIFVIFQTLQARDRKEGTGVGLSIVKKILEGEGATITVDSDVGKGATFCFTWHK